MVKFICLLFLVTGCQHVGPLLTKNTHSLGNDQNHSLNVYVKSGDDTPSYIVHSFKQELDYYLNIVCAPKNTRVNIMLSTYAGDILFRENATVDRVYTRMGADMIISTTDCQFEKKCDASTSFYQSMSEAYANKIQKERVVGSLISTLALNCALSIQTCFKQKT
jgi:hypothetical protein